jgi:uncharacterized protein DUF6933
MEVGMSGPNSRRETPGVVVIHGTKKLLVRLGGATPGPGERSTTALGNWYATVLFWKPQVALFVNEPTLLPVLVPYAPSATVIDRFRTTVVAVLQRHGLKHSFIDHEVTEMAEHRLAKTENRSVVGVMNEFSYLGGRYREPTGVNDLIELSLKLAETRAVLCTTSM